MVPRNTTEGPYGPAGQGSKCWSPLVTRGIPHFPCWRFGTPGCNPPMHITLDRLSRNAATRLSSLPTHSEITQRLPPNWDTHNPELPICSDSTTRTRVSPIAHLAEFSHPECETVLPYLVEPWNHPHPWGSRLKSTFLRDSRKELPQQIRRQIATLSTNDSIVCFTDGSKRVTNGCRKVGLGYSIQHRGAEIHHSSANLGPRFEVFDAEMLALA
ncbi:hypothetical protein B0J17DRAFT_581414, partial [Rhizoctonia solani]